ncbi:MAG TPA: hypothetical protein ENG94_05870 [Actinobacteria bacterium]|nr:hypothetical protein [Actinomycetota bacterium]
MSRLRNAVAEDPAIMIYNPVLFPTTFSSHGQCVMGGTPKTAPQPSGTSTHKIGRRVRSFAIRLRRSDTADGPVSPVPYGVRMRSNLAQLRQGRTPANKGKTYPAEILTSDEFQALLARIPTTPSLGLRNRALIVLLYRTGLRHPEALDLRPEDVDLAAGSRGPRRRSWFPRLGSRGHRHLRQ